MFQTGYMSTKNANKNDTTKSNTHRNKTQCKEIVVQNSDECYYMRQNSKSANYILQLEKVIFVS